MRQILYSLSPYASCPLLYYMIFLLLGLRTAAEMKTSSGRIDAVIELDKRIFIFEFKLGDSASTALQQTKDKGYAEKYRLQGKQITLVGAKFDYKARKLTEWTEAEDGCISCWGELGRRLKPAATLTAPLARRYDTSRGIGNPLGASGPKLKYTPEDQH